MIGNAYDYMNGHKRIRLSDFRTDLLEIGIRNQNVVWITEFVEKDKASESGYIAEIDETGTFVRGAVLSDVPLLREKGWTEKALGGDTRTYSEKYDVVTKTLEVSNVIREQLLKRDSHGNIIEQIVIDGEDNTTFRKLYVYIGQESPKDAREWFITRYTFEPEQEKVLKDYVAEKGSGSISEFIVYLQKRLKQEQEEKFIINMGLDGQGNNKTYWDRVEFKNYSGKDNALQPVKITHNIDFVSEEDMGVVKNDNYRGIPAIKVEERGTNKQGRVFTRISIISESGRNGLYERAFVEFNPEETPKVSPDKEKVSIKDKETQPYSALPSARNKVTFKNAVANVRKVLTSGLPWLDTMLVNAVVSFTGGEVDLTGGHWVSETYKDSCGIKEVGRKGSTLRLRADLKGRDPERSKGEAYVPVSLIRKNFSGKKVTMKIRVPMGFAGRGLHGVQIFAKDANWKVQYMQWREVERAGEWITLEYIPTAYDVDQQGYTQEGFDPANIKRIGIKFAINDSTTDIFKGYFFTLGQAPHSFGNKDFSWVGLVHNSCCQLNRAAEQVVVFGNGLANINTNFKFQWQFGFTLNHLLHFSLHINCSFNPVNPGGKRCHYPIACMFNFTTLKNS